MMDLVFLSLLFGTAAASRNPRPNILFVLTDDMGWGDVSYNEEHYQPGAGGKRWTVNHPRTPHIDSLAKGNHTMLFRRWYTASALCSPTRASILSGRTPRRSCIDSAEGCGQKPAWSCYDRMPFPATEYSVATAVQSKGYATLFVGKWHLGDFWDKGESAKGNYALKKWPASHPGIHGFEEWHATEASASSCTTNCGCQASWVQEGQGCVTGGGVWQKESYDCTNYWSPADLDSHYRPTRPECCVANTTSRDCVANLTKKIEGDDSQYMMDVFEDFLKRKSARGSDPTPWFTQLSIHTNHQPHPALPDWYHAYEEAEGGPAGDYLGTISQMDAAIGRMIDLLKTYGDFDNTMLWFSVGDNGAMPKGRPSGQLSAANGLRQCKASLFEGGIRVPGFVRWPSAIATHVETLHAGVTSDFLPTVLDLLGIKHLHPEWHNDGMSLLPLLRGDLPAVSHRPKPMGFSLGNQAAWQNDTGFHGVWKIVHKPQRGLCDVWEEPYGSMKDKTGPFLFNLTADPTESIDLCKDYSERCAAMTKEMDAFLASIEYSRVHESGCQAKEGPDPSSSMHMFADRRPLAGDFQLFVKGGGSAPGECLNLEWLHSHAALVIGACNHGSSMWQKVDERLASSTADTNMCLKLDRSVHAEAVSQWCELGSTVWLGPCEGDSPAFTIDASGYLVTQGCPGMCGVPATDTNVFTYSSAAVALGDCSSSLAFTFAPAPREVVV